MGMELKVKHMIGYEGEYFAVMQQMIVDSIIVEEEMVGKFRTDERANRFIEKWETTPGGLI